MKKTIIASLAAVAFVGAAYGQGTVNWGNTAIAGNNFTAQTNSTAYSPLFGGGAATGGSVGATAVTGGGFYYAMLYTSMVGYQVAASAPTTLSALGTWTAAGLTATNATGTAGRIVTANQAAAATVPWANGVTNTIMMVGWSANLGTTWADAWTTLNSANALSALATPAYLGLSVIGYINPSTSTTLGVNAFASSQTAQAYGVPITSLNTQLYLIPVPEPSTMALAALGGASLLLFRRRK